MKTTLIVLGLLVSIQAGVQVNISKKVTNYFENVTNSEVSPHRSGLLNEKKLTYKENKLDNNYIVDDDTIFNDTINSKHWKESFANEYLVVETIPNYTQPNNLIKELSTYGLTKHSYDTIEHTSEISIPDYTFKYMVQILEMDGTFLDEDQLRTNAETYVKTHFQKYWNYVEYDRTDLTMQNNKKIIKAEVFFRRIFRGGIVLDDVSFIKITVDPFGNIVCVNIKWPILKEIKSPKKTIPMQNALEIVKNIYSETFTAKRGDDEEASVQNFEITGIARAWHKIEKNDSLFISPCYSFISKAFLNNGQYGNDRINVPLIKNYYIKDPN